MKEMEVIIGKTNYIDGLQISINRKNKTVIPSGTAIHEAKHIIAARYHGTDTKFATIKPGIGYSGLTQLSRADAVAAMGPHATGESGTSWDTHIAQEIGSAGAEGAAKSIINERLDEVMAVATSLEENGTITGADVEKAIQNMDREEFSVSVADSTGNLHEMSQQVTKGEVLMIPGEWVTLSKAA